MSDSIYTLNENFLITSADTDFTKTLKPGALVNIFIQIAWHHAEILDYGMAFRIREGLIWMLSRMQVKIYRHPLWNEQASITTWAKGIRRLFYLRDFEVYNSQNQLVALATSEWLLIDIKSKRPKLYDPKNILFNQNKDKHALKNEVQVLEAITSKSDSFSNKVNYSDIDLNQHLTISSTMSGLQDQAMSAC